MRHDTCLCKVAVKLHAAAINELKISDVTSTNWGYTSTMNSITLAHNISFHSVGAMELKQEIDPRAAAVSRRMPP